LIAGCSSGTEPPVAGDLVIHFVSPNADDRALVLYVDGDTQGVRPASGFRLFSPGVGRSEASSDRFLVIVP
ncbi:MAG: hypothetical protein GWO04_14800, partial [Actinobacteria bacterium]|nr:hypothetical protein [Actinomycetota bacterium]